MAQKDLNALANILIQKLHSSSNAFREAVTSKQVHEFFIDAENIRKKVREELRDILGYSGQKALPADFEKVIVREVPKVTKEFHTAFTRAASSSKTFTIKIIGNSTTSFSVIVESKTGRAKVYNYFRRIKQVVQKPLILALDDLIKNRDLGERRLATDEFEKNGRTRRDVRTPFLDIGHADETTNASLRSQRAEEILLQFTSGKNSPLLNKYVAEIFEDVFARVTKGPVSKDGTVVFKASLDSSKGNKSKALQDAKNAGNLQKALNTLLAAQATQFADQPGSDSSVQVIEKNILNEFADYSTTKAKGVKKKANFKKQKTNTKPSKGKSKSIPIKATAAPAIVERKTKVNRRRATVPVRPEGLNLAMLLGPLNEQINRRVRENMGAPRLENRTGRFAGSVRITDVAVTPQGFPSIGYTYQRAPYDKFESDPDRDPRKLIDRSIREIAAQYAMGRFYTRRG